MLARVCKCNTYVHATCFRALVARVPSHATACPICNTAYETQEEKAEEEQGYPLALVSLLTVSVLFGTDVVLLHMTTAIPWHACFLLSAVCTFALLVLRCATTPPPVLVVHVR